jgi:hypothetical protein
MLASNERDAKDFKLHLVRNILPTFLSELREIRSNPPCLAFRPNSTNFAKCRLCTGLSRTDLPEGKGQIAIVARLFLAFVATVAVMVLLSQWLRQFGRIGPLSVSP